MTCLAVLAQYRRVTDRQIDKHTDVYRRTNKSCDHTVHVMYRGLASRGRNAVVRQAYKQIDTDRVWLRLRRPERPPASLTR